jgi:hypothetical protein
MKRSLRAEQIEMIDPAMADVLRRKTPAQRIEMVCAANRTARMILCAAIKRTHPSWDEDKIAREIARRMLGGTT